MIIFRRQSSKDRKYYRQIMQKRGKQCALATISALLLLCFCILGVLGMNALLSRKRDEERSDPKSKQIFNDIQSFSSLSSSKIKAPVAYHRRLIQPKFPPIYSKQHSLKINIAIPSSCNQKDGRLRKMQRLSWFKFLKDDGLWNNTRSQCKISIKYYVGDCGDFASKQMIKNEKKAYSDIVQMDGFENWEGLQRKTIDIIISEYLDKERPYDVLFKTDTDSYVDLPNLCGFLIELMNENGWYGQQKALYMGALQDNTKVIMDQIGKYRNVKRLHNIQRSTYPASISGSGYFLSHKTTKIIYHSLRKSKDEIVFNNSEDAFWRHYLSEFNVEFVNIESMNKQHHMNGTDMISKYEMHCNVQKTIKMN